jgi:flagellar biosynthesis protein FlhA
MEGKDAVDPTYGMSGKWIPVEKKGLAERLGCMIFDPASIVATHLTETIRQNAGELLGLQEVRFLLDNLRKTRPALVDDVYPSIYSLGQIQGVLQNLLRERVPIRDLSGILEALSDISARRRSSEALAEAVRKMISRVISWENSRYGKVIDAIRLEPEDEEALLASRRLRRSHTHDLLDAVQTNRILENIGRKLNELGFFVLVCRPEIRLEVSRIMARSYPRISPGPSPRIPLSCSCWRRKAPRDRQVCAKRR